MRYVDFVLTGDPARARTTTVEALEAWQFRIAWTDEWTGSAEKGSRTANVLLGGFAQHYHFGLEVRSLEGERSLVRVKSFKSGWWGGLLGVMKTKKRLRKVRERLEAAFSGAGVLVSVTDG